jgi:hypothetical protein
MTPGTAQTKVAHAREEAKMDTVIGTFAAFVFVVGTLTFVGWALFELSPFARHNDDFRDPRTGKFRGPSPRLD